MAKFKRVTEIDEDGESRLVTLELSGDSLYRICKAQMWEARVSVMAIVDVSVRRGGSAADTVTASTKHGTIEWTMKGGQDLVNAIEAAQG